MGIGLVGSMLCSSVHVYSKSAANSHIYSHYLTCMDARALTMTTGVHTISALINRTMTTGFRVKTEL